MKLLAAQCDKRVLQQPLQQEMLLKIAQVSVAVMHVTITSKVHSGVFTRTA